jgi:GH25 family lysozyme M1 (1,4-beta-N-acetylmuramidase)
LVIRPRRTILGIPLTLAVLAVAISGSPGQNPANPKGLDVSVYQGAINWTNVKNAGISFVIIRAGHGGTTGVDTNFATNWAGAKSVGLVRGAYWYVVPSASPSLSANAASVATAFVNTVKPRKGDLQLAIDFEDNGGLSKADTQTWLQACVTQVRTLTHRPPLIYCSPGLWNQYMPSNATSMGCPLWVANWGVSSPTLPTAWTTYAFWQYSDTGNVGGLNPVDQDTCNGNTAFMVQYTYPRDPLDRR